MADAVAAADAGTTVAATAPNPAGGACAAEVDAGTAAGGACAAAVAAVLHGDDLHVHACLLERVVQDVLGGGSGDDGDPLSGEVGQRAEPGVDAAQQGRSVDEDEVAEIDPLLALERGGRRSAFEID